MKKSFFGFIAAALGLGSFSPSRTSAKELPFDPYTPSKVSAHDGKSKRRRHTNGVGTNCRNQPAGYYEQEITDPKHMTPRQRSMHAMGQKIVLGQFYGQPR